MSPFRMHRLRWLAKHQCGVIRLVVALTLITRCLTADGQSEETSEYPASGKTLVFLQHPEVFYDDDRQQQLCKAILSGDLTAVEKAIADGASINAEGRHGVTPLFWAYLSRKYKVFEYLLAKGADPNVSVYVQSDLDPGDNLFLFWCTLSSTIAVAVLSKPPRRST